MGPCLDQQHSLSISFHVFWDEFAPALVHVHSFTRACVSQIPLSWSITSSANIKHTHNKLHAMPISICIYTRMYMFTHTLTCPAHSSLLYLKNSSRSPADGSEQTHRHHVCTLPRTTRHLPLPLPFLANPLHAVDILFPPTKPTHSLYHDTSFPLNNLTPADTHKLY